MQKLLVVDENTTIQRVIKLAFKDEDIRVVTVPRGRDAFEQIEEDPPDIVLADNGREIAAFLKSHPKLSQIPVVLLKGAFDAASDGADEALGCDDVLMKPLQPQTMIDRVKRLLRDRKPARGKAASRTQGEADENGPAKAGHYLGEKGPAKAGHYVDPGLELGRYFDTLSTAFTRAQSAAPETAPEPGWLYPPKTVQTASIPSNGPATPPGRGPATAATPGISAIPVINDELVELVAQRVLDRLGDRVVRSTATELVARLSKWLIMDEVERTRK
jgi:CheY-like chemotaxis protein